MLQGKLRERFWCIDNLFSSKLLFFFPLTYIIFTLVIIIITFIHKGLKDKHTV